MTLQRAQDDIMNGFTSQSASYTTVKQFCLNPYDRRKFLDFFYFCVRYSTAYLRVLSRKGYPLPIENDDFDASLHDIAIDLLPRLFESKPGEPCFRIIDFYRRQGVTDFETATPECLFDKLTILLRGNVKRGLFRRRRVEHAPQENLKRNIKEALDRKGYNTDTSSVGHKLVYLANQEGHLRTDRPNIKPAALYDLVLQAYNQTTTINTSTWLKSIFSRLTHEANVRNMIPVNELMTTIVAVWANARDDIVLSGSQNNSGLEGMLFELVSLEIPAVVVWAKDNLIASSIRKGKLDESEESDYLVALEEYLLDFASGAHDVPLPNYFYARRPSVSSIEYQKHFKYTFETLLNKSLIHLREILQKNPTIRSLWDYLA
jgi:hypothetical protein